MQITRAGKYLSLYLFKYDCEKDNLAYVNHAQIHF